MSREHQRQSDERTLRKGLRSNYKNFRRVYDAGVNGRNGHRHRSHARIPNRSAYLCKRQVNHKRRHYRHTHGDADSGQAGALARDNDSEHSHSNQLYGRQRHRGHRHGHGLRSARRYYVRPDGQRHNADDCSHRQFVFDNRYLRRQQRLYNHLLYHGDSESAGGRQHTHSVVRLLQNSAVHRVFAGRLPRGVRSSDLPHLTINQTTK